MASRMGIPEGKATSTIYGLIREQKYGDAINLLNAELQNFPRSRAALSLLGYCYYYLQDFRAAALVSRQNDFRPQLPRRLMATRHHWQPKAENASMPQAALLDDLIVASRG